MWLFLNAFKIIIFSTPFIEECFLFTQMKLSSAYSCEIRQRKNFGNWICWCERNSSSKINQWNQVRCTVCVLLLHEKKNNARWNDDWTMDGHTAIVMRQKCMRQTGELWWKKNHKTENTTYTVLLRTYTHSHE